MTYFFDTVETIPEGVGFATYGGIHLAWLGVFLLLTVGCCLHYRSLSPKGRKIWQWVVAGLLLADEVYKQVFLLIGGNWMPSYLPLHLCSINIFLALVYTVRPSKALGNFLYTVCIPGALAALLFPSWGSLPLENFMHIHSFTVHILLALFPLVLTVGGDICPAPRQILPCVGILVGLAVVMYFINPLLDANFFFLAYAEEGNPLYIFQQLWGSHLLGFPVLVAGVMLVMHGPVALVRRLRKKTAV